MSNGINKPTIRQTSKALTEQLKEMGQRVAVLEQNHARIVFGVNEKNQAIAGDFQTLRDTVNAIVKAAGIQEQVEALVKQAMTERARSQAAEEATALKRGVEDGYMVPAEFVGPKSLIVGKFVDASGQDVEPGRAQFVFPGLEESFKQQLAGKAAGTEVSVDGGKFVLQEVYEIDVQKMQELRMKLQQAATADAVAKAAAAEAGEQPATN